MENNIVQTQPIISEDPETEGFDLQAGKTWIFPTNCQIREYQFNIIQKALLKNTLVSLPTGLGKTFIAAVVMYNFYRWYPTGKIIFMAPTRPLVKQQIDACYNIMAIPPEVTAELTGAKVSSSRTNIWTEKRVFFVTPQVLQNDLGKIEKLGPKIKCLVFDEAHKARGNHAYCEVIRRLLEQNAKYFRVLALSATPGSNVNDVLEIIQNLLISHLEFRTEESLDVRQYGFQKSLETIVVPLGDKLQEVREEYLKILEYEAKTLIKFKIIYGNCGSLTKGKIFMLMKDYQNKNRGRGSSNYSEIMACLNKCVSLYHAYELLIRHGLRSFLSFFDEHIEKPLLKGNYRLRSLMNDVREYLGPIPNIEVLSDGTYPEIPRDVKFGHPKYYKLRDVLVSHFSQTADKSSRVIVFFEYRESVMEAHTLLLQSRPLVQPKIFLGQGSGITQKVQIGVVKAFRDGKCNTLLSTCIGEEGLDVGEVDLIVCFDIATKSPIRMVQRMGRTGRRRDGRVLALVTEGKEQQTLKDCLIHVNTVSTHVLGSKQLATGLYPDSPRLVPAHMTPSCQKMFITVKTLNKKKNSVKDMLRSISSRSSGPIFSQDIEISKIEERIPKTVMFFDKSNPLFIAKDENRLFYKHIERQRSFQQTYRVKHSHKTETLIDLLSLADSIRFNIPSQITNSTKVNSSKSLKQGDIRNMFLRGGSQLDFEPTQGRNEALKDIPVKVIAKELEEAADSLSGCLDISKELFSLVSNYVLAQISTSNNECRHCPPGFHCNDFLITKEHSSPPNNNNNNWIPSEDIFDTISPIDLENFNRSLDPDDQDDFFDDTDSSIFDAVDFTQLEKDAGINGDVRKHPGPEKSLIFEPPRTYSGLVNKYRASMFAGQRQHSQIESVENILDFFHVESFSDLFGTSSACSMGSSQETVIYSPDYVDLNERIDPPSPVLSSDHRRKRIMKKMLLTRKFRDSRFLVGDVRTCSTPIRALNDNGDENNRRKAPEKPNIDIDDLCDLSHFGLSNDAIVETVREEEKLLAHDNGDNLERKSTGTKSGEGRVLLGIDDICDLSLFGIESARNDEACSSDATRDDLEDLEEEAQWPKDDGAHADEPEPVSPTQPFLVDEVVATPDAIIETDKTGCTEIVDLTCTSPRKPEPSNSVSAKSQLTITQMLSFLNKTSQKEMAPEIGSKSSDVDREPPRHELSILDDPRNYQEFSYGDVPVKVASVKNRSKLSTRKKEDGVSSSVATRQGDPYKCVGSARSENKSRKVNSASSSDEFEDAPRRTSANFKPRTPGSVRAKRDCKVSQKRTAKRSLKKRNLNHYLDLEAEVSDDDDAFVSDDEDDENVDMYERSFVNDETLNFNTQMHTKYLKSIRSPVTSGRFKIPRRPPLLTTGNIYSQPVSNEPDTYLEDSFVVNADDNDLTQQHELSELEILEQKLKKKKKRRKSEETLDSKNKRRRIVCFSSDDSD